MAEDKKRKKKRSCRLAMNKGGYNPLLYVLLYLNLKLLENIKHVFENKSINCVGVKEREAFISTTLPSGILTFIKRKSFPGSTEFMRPPSQSSYSSDYLQRCRWNDAQCNHFPERISFSLRTPMNRL